MFERKSKIADSALTSLSGIFVRESDVYVLFQDGVAQSTDGGITFTLISDKSDSNEVFVDENQYIYLQDTGNKISYVSKDSGQSWIELDFDIENSASSTERIVATNGKMYIATTNGLFIVPLEKYPCP